MSERIFEEIAVIIKHNYNVRLLEYKEDGSEFTEITVYSRDVIEKDRDSKDNFEFSFTVKGRGEEEKEKIERMNEREFREFINHMTLFIEKKYNIPRSKEVKKIEKKEDKNDNKKDEKKEKTKPVETEEVESLDDFNVDKNSDLSGIVV